MQDLRPEIPRLPIWPFLLVDLTLVGGAVLIRAQAETPLSAAPLAAITACLALGGAVMLYPFVVAHARRQEEAVAERIDQVEAIGRTVAAAAEQIGIAATNLPAIAEQSARQLRAAEQLPVALQARLAELQAQLSATAQEENAALRHELDTLRQAETAKMASALEKLSAASADLIRFEALATRHANALDAAAAHLPRLADQFGRQASEALQSESASAAEALRAAGEDAARALSAAVAEATRTVEATAERLRLDWERTARETPVVRVIPVEVGPPSSAEPELPPCAPEAPEPVSAAPVVEAVCAEPEPPVVGAPETAVEASVTPAATDEPVLQSPEEVVPSEMVAEPTAPPPAEARADAAPADAAAATTTPSLVVEPSTAALAPRSDEIVAPTTAVEVVPEAEREPKSEVETAAVALGQEVEDEVVEPVEEEPAPVEPALTHDGCTRLIVTAYIGIGNKLYVRGDGPGLRSDKGVPLQFVAIGKWRWESAELLFPAKVRVLKNDREECPALGELTLEPGHHHEVTARF